MECRHKWREQDRKLIPASQKSPREPINTTNLMFHPCVDKTMIMLCCTKCAALKTLERPGDLRRDAESHTGSKIWRRHT